MDVRGRLGTRYEDFLRPEPVEIKGASGYFSKPDTGLDPHLFAGRHLKASVRQQILNLLYGFWQGRYNLPRSWSVVWLAGSGASHQWGAEREASGPGDLDILIGVDFVKLRRANPQLRGISDAMMAAQMNKEMHDQLWPTTAAFDFGGRQYEVTFYINPGAQDIRDISPYAAYNVSRGDWTVEPIALPGDWGPDKLPKEWWDKFGRDKTEGAALVNEYNQRVAEVGRHEPGTPHWWNATTALKSTTERALAMFDEIHLGRKAAFLGGGKGFLAFENARWQVAKGTGVIEALRAIKSVHSEAERSSRAAMYGS
jgi:hypothetical protein